MANTPVNVQKDSYQALAHALSCGSNLHDASKACGYSISTVYRALRRADFQSELRKALQARVLGEGAALAVQALIDIVQDQDTTKSTRVHAAQVLLDRAGVEAPAHQARGELDLSVMSRDELMQLAQHAEGEIAARAKPVSAAIDQAADPDVADMLS